MSVAAVFLSLGAVQAGGPAGGQESAPPPPAWQLLEKIAEAKGLKEGFDAVPAHLEAMVRTSNLPSRLSHIAKSLAEPWRVPAEAALLRDFLASPMKPGGKAELAPLLAQAAAWIDVTPAHNDDTPLAAVAELAELWQEITKPEVVDVDLLERLSEYMAACHDALRGVTARLDDSERTLLHTRFPDWCESWYRQHFPKGEIEPAQLELFEQYKRLSRKVDRGCLLAVAQQVALLADPAFLAGLPRRLAKTPRAKEKVEGFSGDVIAAAGKGPESRVVLLGPGKTTVSAQAALVIDLGGDDTWQRAAVVDSADLLVSVVLDLNGNDTYGGPQSGPNAAYAAGGVALLVDAKGKDHYQVGRLGEGASAFGCAILMDLAGDDTCVGEDFVQGYTFCGIGLLLDREGDDTFTAWAYAQGAGNGNGFSALVDGRGHDRYVANGHWPDVYGDSGADSFHGASQGYNTGFRADKSEQFEVAGGFAVLADLDGDDYYESGNFSQGGGYYFGFGLMYDGGGDDENHGYRYSQGFGVHQAVGMRWDVAGNDRYVTKCAANCGSAWDEGVGWLIDEAGDDQYDVGGLALGGAANTAVAILLDLGGDDRYGSPGSVGGADSQGGTGDSSYHKKQSIGALLDLGGGKDTYSRKERGNDRLLTGDWFGLFLDAKEKSLEKLLDPKVLEKVLNAKLPKQ